MRVKRRGILWRPDEVAEYLGISESYAESLMNENMIPSVTVGRDSTPRTIKEHVDNFVNGLFKSSKKSGMRK